MIRSPFQRHHMLVSHVSVSIEKVALYQIFVSPILLLQPRLIFIGPANEEEERYIRRLLTPSLSDDVPLDEVLRCRMDEHQQQRMSPVARIVVDREPEVLYIDQA